MKASFWGELAWTFVWTFVAVSFAVALAGCGPPMEPEDYSRIQCVGDCHPVALTHHEVACGGLLISTPESDSCGQFGQPCCDARTAGPMTAHTRKGDCFPGATCNAGVCGACANE